MPQEKPYHYVTYLLCIAELLDEATDSPILTHSKNTDHKSIWYALETSSLGPCSVVHHLKLLSPVSF